MASPSAKELDEVCPSNTDVDVDVVTALARCLVSFIAHPNPQVRLAAIEGAVPYSLTHPNIFKIHDLQPVRNLKVLLRDHPKIGGHALTILVNLSGEDDVLDSLTTDDKFLDLVLSKIVVPTEPNANLLSMLLANMSKRDNLKDIIKKRQTPPEELKSDDLVINQLLDLFVKGFDGTYNKHANYDYLAYFFADLTKHEEVRKHFITRQSYDGTFPIAKLNVFTEHKSEIRRRGVASTIKNVTFEVSSHPDFLSESDINVLPYILLPIMGGEEYDEDDMLDMLPDLQLLPPDKQREPNPDIIQTHVETLTLLASTRDAREYMREVKVYPLIRETHARVDHEGVREACERLVQLLMGEEAKDGEEGQAEDEDEDNQLVEV
ncbi:related to FAM203 family protein C1020.12c [Cephalotrichum gorgonifer]|uniref:Related to FAM203 family protein C1020.12c n=1 Tax=Cephalotrichum gorgonifer TaxID=2041049 RepID=A0AAE8MS93_9PEZI|nr:related to FAM203 family protein C1020.12c [Cephalotrichum gorgonifer]